jgi:hypothetical protein
MFGVMPNFAAFGRACHWDGERRLVLATRVVWTVWAEPMGWVCERSGMRRDKLWQWGLLQAQ